MGHGIYTASAGAVARRTQLEIVASNMANANTTGFRAQRVSFEEVLPHQEAPNRHLTAVGHPVVSPERGPLARTERPLDLAMQDEGFFVAESPGGRVLLRSLSATLDASGVLRDTSGRRLVFAGGDSTLDPSRAVQVGDYGQLTQDGREVARLLLARVPNARALRPAGAGAYLPTQESGQAFPVSAKVVSGALEQSNVNTVSNMVRMISVEREYQSITRVIHAYREADEGILNAGGQR